MVTPQISDRYPSDPSELLELAKFSIDGCEFWLAHVYCVRGLACSTKDCLIREELKQARLHCEQEIQSYAQDIPEIVAAIYANPKDGTAHFYLGMHLHCLGHVDRSIEEYQLALRYFDSMEWEEQRECLNSIGWHHYRRGDCQNALPWFERACWFENVHDPAPYHFAMGNLILAYSELGMREEAKRVAIDYARLCGPIPPFERRALSRINIDADSIIREN